MQDKRIGIDPGASGAVVVLFEEQPIHWMLMPTVKVGSATQVSPATLAAFLRQHSKAVDVFLEKVGAMPGQGVVSMFNFGHSCGVVSGVLGALEMPITLVTPQSWKKRAGLLGQDKDAARCRALQLWPHWRELDKKGEGQAYADAALIALYGS